MKYCRITIAAFLLLLAAQSYKSNAKTVNNEIANTAYTQNRVSYNRYSLREIVYEQLLEMAQIPNAPDVYYFENTRMIDCFYILGLDSINAVEFHRWLEDEFYVSIHSSEFYELMGETLTVFCEYLLTKIY